MPFHEGLDGCFADRTAASAAAEITAKLNIQLVGLAYIAAVVPLEKRHNEPRRAIAALRAVALDHLLLHRMEFFASDSLNGNDFAPGHQAERHQATIDRAITRSALRIAVKN